MNTENRSEDWSERLKEQTRIILDGGGTFVPLGDQICLKHIDGAFGTITVPEWLGGVLRVVDRDTEAEITYASVDELIGAGWAVD